MGESLASMGPAVANHLWQSTAFAVVAAGLALALRRNHARARYWVWLAASAKFLVPFALLIGLGGMLPRPQHTVVTMPVYSAVDEVGLPFSDMETIPVAVADPTHDAIRPRHEWGTRMWREWGTWPVVLAVVWLSGVVVVVAMWWVRWRQVARAMRRAVAAQAGREAELLRRVEQMVGARVRLVLSRELMEPGIFGVFRPVLMWPERLSERLDDEHIEAILAHELVHVRRRDNLAAAMHMLVEAAFWFHPLVWWIQRRMVEERERACDEAVVEMGSRPGVYAESLLKAVRFCVESPLVCVAGVTGADLSKRVRSIMTLRLERLGWGRKLVLLVVALVTVAVPVLLGQAKAAQRMVLAVVNAAPQPVRAWAAAHTPIEEEQTPSTGLIAEMQAEVLGQASQPTQVSDRDYRVWLDQDARWLISPAERVAFLKLTNDEERDKFIEQFWARKGSAAGMSVSGAYKAEIYARFAYANQHFATDNGPGWSTDRGRIYIVFGKPDEVKAQPAIGADTWTYGHIAGVGDNIVLNFATGPGGEPYQLLTQYPTANWNDLPRVCCAAFPIRQPDAPAEIWGAGMGGGDLFAGGRINSNSDKAIFFFRLGWAYVLPTGLDFHVGETIVPYNGMPPHGTYGFGEQHVPRRLDATELLVFVEQVMLEDGTDWRADHKQIEANYVRRLGGQLPFPGANSAAAQANPLKQSLDGAPGSGAVPEMRFEVATVKPAAPLAPQPSSAGSPGMPARRIPGAAIVTITSDRASYRNITLKSLLMRAYGLEALQISGPAWIDSEHYDVVATIPEGTAKEDVPVMLQHLLAERFRMALHSETKEFSGYTLGVGKAGSKLKVAVERKKSAPVATATWRDDSVVETMYGATMPVFARDLSRRLGRPVIDSTGLSGEFDIVLSLSKEMVMPGAHEAGADGPSLESNSSVASLFTAVQDLGLTLNSDKVPLKCIVVDKAEKIPTEN